MPTRFLIFAWFLLIATHFSWSDVTALPPVNLSPENGSFFDWEYVENSQILFFPMLRTSKIKDISDYQLDSLRDDGIKILQNSFPQIAWKKSSEFPSNKRGPLKRSSVRMTSMTPFVVDICKAENARSGLIAYLSYEVRNRIPLYKCELLLIDSEASCQVARVTGWTNAENGLVDAVVKAADLLAEQHLFVVRPKISFSLILNEKGRRTGASIPVGSRVGLVEKSRLAILGANKDGISTSIGFLEINEEGLTNSICKISGVSSKVDLSKNAICIPIDRDVYKVIKLKR